jgi:hypothetical protein
MPQSPLFRLQEMLYDQVKKNSSLLSKNSEILRKDLSLWNKDWSSDLKKLP